MGRWKGKRGGMEGKGEGGKGKGKRKGRGGERARGGRPPFRKFLDPPLISDVSNACILSVMFSLFIVFPLILFSVPFTDWLQLKLNIHTYTTTSP